MKTIKLKNTVFSGFEVKQTSDINMFVNFDSNREASPSHVNGIFKSMQNQLLYSPIYTNETLGIIDGQHRLEAFRKRAEKGLPVVIDYITFDGMNYNQDDVSRFNTNAENWNFKDYIHSQVEQGNEKVKAANDFLASCKGITRGAAMVLLTGGTSLVSLKNGTIEYTDADLAFAYYAFDCLKDFNAANLGFWKEVLFVKAFKHLLTSTDDKTGKNLYEHGFMKFAMTLQPVNKVILRQKKVNDYVKELFTYYYVTAVPKAVEEVNKSTENITV